MYFHNYVTKVFIYKAFPKTTLIRGGDFRIKIYSKYHEDGKDHFKSSIALVFHSTLLYFHKHIYITMKSMSLFIKIIPKTTLIGRWGF